MNLGDPVPEHRRGSPWPGVIAFVTFMVCVTAVLLALILT